MTHYLSEDTKAILLICGVFGKDRSHKPLTTREYSKLVRWLVKMELRPADLLNMKSLSEVEVSTGLEKERLKSLIGRGVQLGFAVEEWQRSGIWVVSRSDEAYPARLKKQLKDKAPPLIFGAGNQSLLKGGGLAVVGSRNVDEKGSIFTQEVAEVCARNGMPVISGGARGVDQVSMVSVLEAGGVTIGVLAENLLKKSVERSARMAIADDRLLLISPYHPTARFTVGTAMGRNKLIYAMADYGLIVSADYKKGGTWAGAEEELKRDNGIPVFVRVENGVLKGNKKLLELGAFSWPASLDKVGLKDQLELLSSGNTNVIPRQELDLFSSGSFHTSDPIPLKDKVSEKVSEKTEEYKPDTDKTSNQASVYDVVLPILLEACKKPMKVDDLAI